MTEHERPSSNGRRALYTGLFFGSAIAATIAFGTSAAAEDNMACRNGDEAACVAAAYETTFTITTAEALLVVGGFFTHRAHMAAQIPSPDTV